MSRLVRNLVFALAASVLVNVFFVGMWAGRFMRSATREARGPDAVEIDGTAPMRGVWRRRDAVLRPRSEAVDAARRAVRDALVAEPYNPEAMETALTNLRAQTDSAQVALHRALADAARELGPEDRRRLAESRWFEHRGPRVRPGSR
jgi:uncharacterized membrane protein